MLLTESNLRKIIAEEFENLQKEGYRDNRFGSRQKKTSMMDELIYRLEDEGLYGFIDEVHALNGESKGTGGSEKGINRNPSHGNISNAFQKWLLNNGQRTIYLDSGKSFDVTNKKFQSDYD